MMFNVYYLFRVLFYLIVASFIGFKPLFASAENTKAIWIEAEGRNRPFRSKEETLKYLEFIEKNNFHEIYLQVYREGRSWFPSKHADPSPYFNSLNNGFDPIQVTLNFAKKKGIKVFAWMNIFRVDKNAPVIKEFGPDIVLVDNFKRSLLTYDALGQAPYFTGASYGQLDTPGLWLDPSSTKFHEYLVLLIRELISSYPEIDGLHLDMIRFPFFLAKTGIDLPYGDLALGTFFSQVGKYPPKDRHCKTGANCADLQTWSNWKRSKITEVVRLIRRVLNDCARKYDLSAAVIADKERGYNHAFQDWKTWLKEDIVNKVLIMNYAKDTKTFEVNLRSAIKGVDPNRIYAGIGAWLLLNSKETFLQQVNYAKAQNTKGVVLFSYSNLLNPKGAELIRAFIATN